MQSELTPSPILATSLQNSVDKWNAELAVNIPPDKTGSHDHPLGRPREEAGLLWNSLGHRRVHSAPNIMERMGEVSSSGSCRWGDPGLLLPSSDQSEAGIRDQFFPENRRYQVGRYC